VRTPLREFLRTETGGAAVLLAAAVAALAWVNVHASSYESLWGTTLSIEIGGAGVSLSLREWVNSGLMTFFFLVLGLEARREFDLGELRERRWFALPLLAAIGGMAVAVTIYLLFNAGSSSARGWGIAMSTDTAFALGLLALVEPRFPDRLRAFMLTAVVFDDLVALVVIATVYTETLRVAPLVVAVGCSAAVLVAARRSRFGPRVACSLLGVGAWVALLEAGVEPVVIGLAMGLLAYAYPVPRSRLERATKRFREFREQPTAELARVARVARVELRSATSVNERLQQRFHPWTSYVIVPLFALANAGSRSTAASWRGRSARRSRSGSWSATWPASRWGSWAARGCSWLLTRLSRGRLQPPVVHLRRGRLLHFVGRQMRAAGRAASDDAGWVVLVEDLQ
jgi:Na+/H+ antiporter NhaA